MALPAPINGTEQYLAAVLEEIRGLRSDVGSLLSAVGPRETGGEVEIREPDQPRRRKG